MLFDLKGRRRRVVQVTYVGLAVLMGGGLVLSGIGSSASGGLLDALVGGGNNSSQDDAKKPFNNQIKVAQAKLAANPKDQAALATLVRAHFGLAGLEQDQSDDGSQVSISDKGIAEMRKAADAWKRYMATNPEKIDTGLAATAIQIYRVIGLPESQNDKNELVVAPARAIAEQENTVDAYIRLVAVATQAGDTRTAGLAERKALSFAKSKEEKATIKERIATEKAAAQQQQQSASGAGGNGAAPPAGGP
jgi:hypothetical protein